MMGEDRALFYGAAMLAGIALFAAIKLAWGMLLWTQPTKHRIGDRWGDEEIEVIDWRGGEGRVESGGEIWRAVSKEPLRAGDRVTVRRMKGLTLEVRRASANADKTTAAQKD